MGKHSHRWSEWTEWQWSQHDQTYIRTRWNEKGDPQTQYHDETPRTENEDAVSQVAQGLANVQLGSHDESIGVEEEYTTEPESKSKSKSKGKSKSHKGKSRAHDDDQSASQAYQAYNTVDDQSAYGQTGYGHAAYGQDYGQTEDTQASTYASGDASADAYGDYQRHDYQQTGNYATTADYSTTDYHNAGYQATGYQTGAYQYGEASGNTEWNDGGPEEAGNTATTDPAYMQRQQQWSYGYGTHVESDADTAVAEQSNTYQSEYLDNRYAVQPSSKFRAGEIFKVFWSEPKGKKIPSLSGREETVSHLGELVHTGFRRFIVIANDQGHCTCVPILTYESKACTKKGVKPDRHGIIHDERKKAKTLSNEPTLGFKPVRAQMTEPMETLAKESRVNYSKPSTIEHNALVLFIGRIHPDDFSIVKKAYSRCWERKNHHHRK
ncbi:unnamed protein product [Clonostachys rosea]|uniref:DUF6590 domain-containing protein n=1 Tax=Bionectria ochroleuca TaxID=29856 RepID=A0ABY6UQE0_BIOOC|nr:unnamed protein product [Clonostachys rosea]